MFLVVVVLLLAALSQDDRILCATAARCRCILVATVVGWQAIEAFWNKQHGVFTNSHQVIIIFTDVHFLFPQ